MNVRRPALILAVILLAACKPSVENKPAKEARIIAGNTLGGRMIRYRRPVYPRQAKREHIEGVVKLNVTIDKRGYLADIQVVSGNPALAPAAVDAVKQWQYEPVRLNGDPVEVKTEIDVSFTLSQ